MFTHTITILRIVMLIILDTGTPPYQRTRRAADPDHGSADILSSQAGDEGMELEELEEIPRHAASEVLTIVAWEKDFVCWWINANRDRRAEEMDQRIEINYVDKEKEYVFIIEMKREKQGRRGRVMYYIWSVIIEDDGGAGQYAFWGYMIELTDVWRQRQQE
jgi:hypothetical protein